jgi:hypothetical protein
MHLDAERIRDVFDRESPVSAEVQRAAVEHLSKCPQCWKAAIPVLATLPRRLGRPKTERYGDARDALLALLEVQEEGAKARLHAKQWAGGLVGLSPGEQGRRIGEVGSVVSVEVFEALVAQARSFAARDHALAEQIGKAALLIVDRLPTQDYPESVKGEMQAKALLQISNATRLQCDWPNAQTAMRSARKALTNSTSSTFAEMLSLNGALECDLGNLRVAEEFIGSALHTYTRLEDQRGVAFCHLQLAEMSTFEPRKQNEQARKALEIVSGRWPRLEMFGRLLYTESLISLQRLPEALFFYDDSLPTFEGVSEGDALKVKYVEAQLLDAMGDARLADKAYSETIDGFSDLDFFKASLMTRFSFFASLFRRKLWARCLDVARKGYTFISKNPRAHPQMRALWRNLELATGQQIITAAHLEAVKHYLVLHWAKPADGEVTFRSERIDRADA